MATSNAGIIMATLFIGSVSAAIALFIHFDSGASGLVAEKTKIEAVDEEKNKPTPYLNFVKIFVTPIDTKIPSSFFLEISNTGSAPAKDFTLSINFGESNVERCEFIPESISSLENEDTSVIKAIRISELGQEQSFYVVCATNSPIFKSVSMGGGNVGYSKKLSYAAYKEQLDGASVSFYETLLRVILSTLVGISLIYMFARMIGSLG